MTRRKVLVVGAGEAGKSTLIEALAPGALNLAVNGRTVAMDHAMLRRGSSTLSLVGVPGQVRFAPVREILTAGARCVLWVHRAGSEPDAETIRLVGDLADLGVPFLVFVNHHGTGGGDDGWRAPAGLPPPRAVLAGDPVARPGDIEPLRTVLWRVAEEHPPHHPKGA